MFGQDTDGKVIQHGYIRCCQGDFHRAVVRCLNTGDILIIGCDLRGIVRIHDGIQRKLHIRRCKGLAVMEFYVFSQIKGIGLGSFIPLPALCKGRHYFVLRIMSGQSCKDQRVNLSMFIERRIDVCIITASVNKSLSILFLI